MSSLRPSKGSNYPKRPMPDQLGEYRTRGWTEFASHPSTLAWATACAAFAARVAKDPAHDSWWRCARTWFVGVNILPNADDGSVGALAIPPLAGPATDFLSDQLGYQTLALDAAQISIVTSDYPGHGDEESAAAYRYRIARCAAHMDGLERILPGRRRRLSETHGFLLGIPLSDAGPEQGAFVVWEGSHEVMRAAFKERFAGVPADEWRGIDITDTYTDARQRVFDTCKATEIAPGLGCAYVMHPLALHGIAPWRGADGPPRAVAYFRPDTVEGDPAHWLAL